MYKHVRGTVALLISLIDKLTSTVRRSRLAFPLAAAILLFAALSGVPQAAKGATCANSIACENLLPGTPPSVWDVSKGEGTTIQGFAAPFSVNIGQTIQFKIESPATSYKIDIYRMGYYGGDGARLEASVTPNISISQNQPACNTDTTTGLTDCSNWGVSASWSVPTTAVSGVYFAHIYRTDGSTDENQIPFVVRDDASHSDIIFKTSDETWQAYNDWGGNSLYSGTATLTASNKLQTGRAVAVSYDRPFATRFDTPYGQDYFFYAEFPMIEFLEENGYDVSYTDGASVAADTGGAILSQHKAFMSTGHDEYWSAPEVTNVTAARNKGLNLAFFSGNEIYWKTRWSSDAAGMPYRTLITYKESLAGAPTDPSDPPTWTGEWADPRFSPPGDGGQPQNALTGQLWTVNEGTYAVQVPSQYAKLRFWRNTAVASLQPGQTETLAPETLGYEWDEDIDNGFRPPGLIDMSSTTETPPQVMEDYQEDLGALTATHHLTLYRAASGALVFGAGTVQWAWGLNAQHDGDSKNPPDPTMQQATINILADMDAQPTTLMSGMVAATASTDTTPPTSTITSPAPGTNVSDGASVTVSGTATDSGGGIVAGVEVSTDGGVTWHPVTTMSPPDTSVTWSYTWTAHGSPTTTIETRATDDSGNIETPSDAETVNVGCPCSIWGASVVPGNPDSGDGTSVELGVKFTSDVYGSVNGIRFYKATTNTGTHIGNLWTASGQLLASATFTNETATGWQQVNFAQPVYINPNTTYIASYFAPNGHYSESEQYFDPPLRGGAMVNSPPLHAERDTQSNPNGLYLYTKGSAFPTQTYNGENYSVDVSFTPATAPGMPTNVTATPGTGSATVSWTPASSGSPATSYTVTPYIGTTAQTPVTVTGNPAPVTATVSGLTNGTPYTFTVTPSNSSGSGPVSAASNVVTPTAPTAPGAPTAVTAIGGNGSASVSWTAPASNGGSAITGYTITSYLSGVAQASTTVTGTPPTTTTTVTGLTNGQVYTFTVTATNAVGSGPASSVSNPVTPSANPPPAFVQQASIHAASVSSLSVTPSKPLGTGNRLVVEVGVWSGAKATTGSVTDTAGDTFSEVSHFTGPDQTEQSVWTAPITAGAGGTPTVTAKLTSAGDAAITALEYSGLSAAAGSAAIDAEASASGTTTTASTVSSASTTATGAANELAVGFYSDSGFGDNLTAGSGYTARTSISNTGDMELLAEDQVVSAGATPSASVGTGAKTAWEMATVVFKIGSQAPPTVPATPGSVAAVAGNASATVNWTAPSNGGSAITGYTVTPYIGGTAQPVTTVSGSATSATVNGLVNGTSYTFTVTATNSVGSGPASAASNSVTPSAQTTSAAFVQQVSAHSGGATSLSVTPGANLTIGNRLVVLVGVWGSGSPTAGSVTDSAGDTFTEALHFKAGDGTEMSVWTAPIVVGGGMKPKITVTPTAKADVGIEAMEYSGLSTTAGTGAIDQMASASGTTGSTAATVQSGATAVTTAANELALGFYVDSGFGDTLTPGTGFTQRGNVSPDGDMEFLTEDAPVGLGATPSATVGTGSKTIWLMATVVFKA
jgi:N,N-dimethylformamidase beta subunit-like, C-terminal/Domain of unknown function (DUF4082)/Fibronectin type III domain/Bacterial Ig domain